MFSFMHAVFVKAAQWLRLPGVIPARGNRLPNKRHCRVRCGFVGAIGQSGTGVLFGGNAVKLPPFSGLSLTLGGWVDDEELLGVEGSGFVFERGTKRVTAGSDAAGNPPLYFPVATPGGEMGIPIADPLRGFSGTVGL